MKKRITTKTFTLASGQTSNAIECQGISLMGILCPASISSTAMTFTMSNTMAGTYVGVNDDAGNAISITVASSKYIALLNKHMALRGIQYLKCVAGASETDKTFTLFFIEE